MFEGDAGNGKEDEEGKEVSERYRRALVVEDSPTGVRARVEAGCRVLGVATNVGKEVLREAGAEWVVRDLMGMRIGGGWP